MKLSEATKFSTRFCYPFTKCAGTLQLAIFFQPSPKKVYQMVWITKNPTNKAFELEMWHFKYRYRLMHKRWHLLQNRKNAHFSALNDLLKLSLYLDLKNWNIVNNQLFVYKKNKRKVKLTAPLRPSTLGVLLPADLCNNKK